MAPRGAGHSGLAGPRPESGRLRPSFRRPAGALGWLVDLPVLEGLIAGMPKMVPVTAFCFSCLGARPAAARQPLLPAAAFSSAAPRAALPARRGDGAFRAAPRQRCLGILSFLSISTASRCSRWVAADALGGATMAPASALNFLLLGMALLLPRWGTFRLFPDLRPDRPPGGLPCRSAATSMAASRFWPTPRCRCRRPFSIWWRRWACCACGSKAGSWRSC